MRCIYGNFFCGWNTNRLPRPNVVGILQPGIQIANFLEYGLVVLPKLFHAQAIKSESLRDADRLG